MVFGVLFGCLGFCFSEIHSHECFSVNKEERAHTWQSHFALTVALDGHYRSIPIELFFSTIEEQHCFHAINALLSSESKLKSTNSPPSHTDSSMNASK